MAFICRQYAENGLFFVFLIFFFPSASGVVFPSNFSSTDFIDWLNY